MFAMHLNRAREDDGFNIAPDFNHVFGRHRMIDMFDGLMDDRSFIKVGCDIVRSCPDQFHAPRMRLMIRFGTLEAGQEGVMNIDAATFKFAAQIWLK